jgi:hypothetical protein
MKNITPIFQIEYKNKNKEWQINLIKEICEMAIEKEIVLNDKYVFDHLKNGEFKAKEKGRVDRACGYLQLVYDGIFLRQLNLFGRLKENVLEAKRTKEAVAKLKSCAGDIQKIRAFMLRSASNYFDACEQGNDCAQMLKDNWPVYIDEFFMKKFYNSGDQVAYFLLHRYRPETIEMGEAIKIMENCGLPYDMIKSLDNYGAKYIVGYVNSTGTNTKKYWQNITKLVKAYCELREADKTSYGISSYFGFILEEVQKQADYCGELYPDIFSLASNTIKQVMRIIKDK